MRTVIFDIGQVIINGYPERAFEQVMPADEIPEFLDRIGFHSWNAANDVLADTGPALVELMARFPADAAGIRAYDTHFLKTLPHMVPGTSAVIAELAQAGVPIAALTNWAGDKFALARPHFGILSRFSDIVVSGEEGIMKPDPAFFRLACTRFGCDPAEAVFIDDSPKNVAGAAALGMAGLQFTSAAQLRADLVALGLLDDPLILNEPIYHLALRRDWTSARHAGGYDWSTRDRSLNEVGFVHCSFANQIPLIRAEIYGDLDWDELVLLRLDPGHDLPIVVEDEFPHLFAPLPITEVHESALA